MFWIFLILSIPVFYIIGIASTIHHFFGKKKLDRVDRSTYLKTTIAELEKIVQVNPTKNISEQLAEYKNELSSLAETITTPIKNEIEKEEKEFTITESKPHSTDIESIWQNWYSDNSINLLLYIGAFLIVSSASIFISFQWEVLSGYVKALLLSLLALAFLLSGLYFYSIPKIKNAGSVFTIIGALLIPLCGAAWYNFALKDAGVPLGMAWIVTSFISLGIYLALALVQRSKFYVYASSISTISLCLSFVNLNDFGKEFYVLAGIFSSLILLFSNIAIQKKYPKLRELVAKPMEITANVTLPLTLVYGLGVALMENKLFSIEASISIFLSAFYYYLLYIVTKKSYYVALVEILFSMAVLVLLNYLKLPTEFIIYAIGFLAALDMGISYLYKQSEKTEESDVSLFMGQTKLIILFLFSIILNMAAIHQVILAAACALAAIIVAHMKNKMQYEFITAIFLAIALFIFNSRILNLESFNILSLIYLLVGVVYFGLTYIYKNKKDYLETFSFITGFFYLMALLFSVTDLNFLTLNSFASALSAFFAAYLFGKKDFVYLSNLFLYVTLFNLMRIFHTPTEYYPIAFVGLNFALYAATLSLTQDWQLKYRYSSLAGGLATPIIFGLYSLGNSIPVYDYYAENILEKYALASAYGATILFALDTYSAKSRMEYFTSAIGMVTLLWQIKILGITEIQWYSASIGIYFMVLGHLRKLKEDFSRQEVLEYLGLAFLLLPTLFQAFGENGFFYALLLGIWGISLIVISITLQNIRYRYSGIAAIVLSVLSQTYTYLFELPRWLITGIAGLIFLAVAIYLLLRRTSKFENTK